MTSLLHAESHVKSVGAFFSDVLLDGFIDTLKIALFLFLAYLLMEFIEHKASERSLAFMQKAGAAGPLAGGLLGAVPQCGFSAVAANLYTGRVITLGSLVAVLLSTSDEMLPILISGRASATLILTILIYKAAVGIIVGFIIDIISTLIFRNKENLSIEGLCEVENCHCKEGIFRSALHHTLTVGAFILIVTVFINTLVFFVGADKIAEISHGKPVVTHLISAILGLIPNCAISVALTDLYLDGIIGLGTMLSGLFSGAGVGLLVLFKVNKRAKENFIIIFILILCGVFFGLLADLIDLDSLIAKI